MNVQKIEINNIIMLPDELINHIYDYINPISLIFTSKENYFKYHYLLKEKIKDRYESYIREIIRRDNIFSMRVIINENIKIWNNIKKYRYKNILYNSYFDFLLQYALNNYSNKIANLILETTENNGLKKNTHKKNIKINSKWRI